MDDDYNMFNEKQSIRDSARTLKKYGSTCCNNIRNNEMLIRHDVDKSDTLQGIALKYGCTTEQIRRTNRLFASDSLFLRQYLLIPVDKTSSFYPKNNENNAIDSNIDTILTANNDNQFTTTTTTSSSSSTATATETATTTTTIHASNSCASFNNSNNITASQLPQRPYSIAGELLDDSNASFSNHNSSSSSCSSSNSSGSSTSTNTSNSSKQSKSLDSVVTMTPEEENRKCINDFLNKIDNTISESRKYVERSKEMITSQSDDGLFITTDIVERRRNNNINNSYKNNRQTHQNHMRHSSTGSSSDTAQLLNTTQTRRVQNSLKRLEKQQDEFFEL